jgi:hypothetical protein
MKPRSNCVGIIGHDHCGSTALCRLLATVPGLSVGGELHWLIDVPPSVDSVPMRAGWHVSRWCAVHGDSCDALGKEFTSQLRDSASLYEVARGRLGGGVLISSDKYPSFFERHARAGQMLGIVLFKHPYRAIASDVITNRRTFEDSMSLWSSDYSKILGWAPRYCQDVFWLRYESFAREPRSVLDDLCDFIGVERTTGPAILATDYHFIGGNAPARSRADIAIDEKWKGFLTPEMQRTIDDNEGVRKVLESLESRCRDG